MIKKLKNKMKVVMMVMAMLMAINIVSGDYFWKRVPRLMKTEVKKQLELLGHPELAKDEK